LINTMVNGLSGQKLTERGLIRCMLCGWNKHQSVIEPCNEYMSIFFELLWPCTVGYGTFSQELL